MDDEEDIKKMIEVLEKSEEDSTDNLQYDGLINIEDSDSESKCSTICNEEANPDFFATDVSNINIYDPVTSLNPEERKVIGSCGDKELKSLLVLNRTKNMQLIHMHKKFRDLLLECHKNIADKEELIKSQEKRKAHSRATGAWRLGFPYFKDNHLYPAPQNLEAIRRLKGRELNIYDLNRTKKWSAIECKKLLNAVKVIYNIGQQSSVFKIIYAGKLNNEDVKEFEARLQELKEGDTEVPPIKCDKYIDWSRLSEKFFPEKRSAEECRRLWHLYLHPDINKKMWTKKESNLMEKLVKTFGCQNWDLIAEKLNSNRTGFLVCMNYQRNLHNLQRKGDYTPEEDSKILELVGKLRAGSYIPWAKISHHFEFRTRQQLFYRYTYYLAEDDRKKGKFTDAEDVMLMIAIDKFGKNFKKCSQLLESRSAVQCKMRYGANLQNKIKKGSFTLIEDKKILEYVKKNGTKHWTGLTKEMQRSRGQLRQRFTFIREFLKEHPDETLDGVPRRKHNISEDNSFQYLRRIADRYQNKPIPTMEDIEQVFGKKSDDSFNIDNRPELSPANVDDLLTNFFCNHYEMTSPKEVTSTNLTKAVEDVQSILDLLHADLNIPDNFDKDTVNLDNLDVAILMKVLSKKQEPYKSVGQLVPPNLCTMIGIRSLLARHSQLENGYSNKATARLLQSQSEIHPDPNYLKKLKDAVQAKLLVLSPDTRQTVLTERKTFRTRFRNIFKLSAIIMSREPPERIAFPEEFQLNRASVKRTYGKSSDVSKTSVTKRAKIINASIDSQKRPITLTPVTSSSVLQDLIKNKNKKLFHLNRIKQDGKTEMVIKQIQINRDMSKIPSTSTTCQKNIASPNDRTTKAFDDLIFVKDGSDVVSLTDLDDLQKLNNLLASHADENKDDDPGDDSQDLKKLELFLHQENALLSSLDNH